MPASKRAHLHGWGRTPVRECVAYRPEKRRELLQILSQHGAPLLARGLGRSYGDAALQPTGVICTSRFDHLIDFDTSQGLVRAQAGVTLEELMNLSIPRGFLPPVIPGTRHITLGGAFACNIHGKNHFREGDFAEHVLSIRLTLAGGKTIDCSPDQHGELFWATAGGMGMTGIIEELTLRLKPIQSASLGTLTYRVDSIDDMVAAFEHYRSSAEYLVGWIDHMARGDRLGQGVFEAAGHVTQEEGGAPLASWRPQKARLTIPCFAPSFLLNRRTMALYNRKHFGRISSERKTDTVDFNNFFHPLDSIRGWNRLYGRRGFFQYQCLIPEATDSAASLRDFLELLHAKKLFSFLAVIKYHRDGKGFLTFPLRGYSLALDFPNTARVRASLPLLDEWVAERGGRIYLAKDATLSPELFDRMYGQAAADWRDIVQSCDANGRFSSLMAQRLQWKRAA